MKKGVIFIQPKFNMKTTIFQRLFNVEKVTLVQLPYPTQNQHWFNVGIQRCVPAGHWPVRQRMIIEMGDYAWSEHIVTVFLACQITIKSNLQSKEKQPQTVTPPPPKTVVPKMWLSWNEVFRWRQTLARPSVGCNKKWLIRPVDPSPCANSPRQMIMWPVKSSIAMT